MARLIFTIILFIILAIFIALNAQYITTVNFFSYVVENVSVAAVVTVTLAVGVVYSFTLYLSSFFAKSRAMRLKNQRRKNKVKADELAAKAKEIDLAGDELAATSPPKGLFNKTRKSVRKSSNGKKGLFGRGRRERAQDNGSVDASSEPNTAPAAQQDQTDR